MKVSETGFEGLLVIEPKIFGDQRGYFFESFNQKSFLEAGLRYQFVQDNETLSHFGTIRGLHFQKGEFAQAKLVRVLQGRVQDVVVDLRPQSKTYKKYFSVELCSDDKKMMIVPRGFAHGFAVLSETALFSYKCDNFYSPSNEMGIIYNDPLLDITWKVPENKIILSEKDKMNASLTEVLKRL